MALGAFNIEYSIKEGGKRSNVEWDLKNDFSGEASLAELLQFTKGALLKISSDVLREEQGRGFDKKPTLVVDGKFNKRPEDVNPLGKIQYVARQSLRQVIIDTYDAILKRSPFDTGEYFKSNVVTFNGSQIANDMPSLLRWLEAKGNFENKDIIRFVNTAPYARKLERYGVTEKGSSTKVRKKDKYRTDASNRVLVPNGTYALAYKAIQRKYKNNSFIKFRLVLGSDLGLTGEGRTYKTKGPNFGRTYMYPTILISAVEAGITDGKLQ